MDSCFSILRKNDQILPQANSSFHLDNRGAPLIPRPDIHRKALGEIRIFIAVHDNIYPVAASNIGIPVKPYRIQWIQNTVHLIRILN